MSAGNILNMNQPMGAKLIRILYCIGLVLIALGTLAGVVGGVRTMMRPMPPMTAPAAATAPMAQPTTPPPPQAANPNRPNMGPGMGRRGFGGRGMRGPRMGPPGFRGPGFRRGPFMMGMRLPPPALGALRIFLVLLRGLIAIMIIRVLAEIGTAILLAMGPKQTT